MNHIQGAQLRYETTKLRSSVGPVLLKAQGAPRRKRSWSLGARLKAQGARLRNVRRIFVYINFQLERGTFIFF